MPNEEDYEVTSNEEFMSIMMEESTCGGAMHQ
jgi:hypothetical protein